MKVGKVAKGWKGYAGALALISLGIWLLYEGRSVEAVQCIGIGLGLLGIRHKLDYEG